MLEPTVQGIISSSTKIFITPENNPEVDDLKINREDADHSSDEEVVEIAEDFLAGSIGQQHAAGNAIPTIIAVTTLDRPLSYEDGFTLYVRTSELSHMGILSGDWVSHPFCPRVSRLMVDASLGNLLYPEVKATTLCTGHYRRH
jgi:hypothetical protein